MRGESGKAPPTQQSEVFRLQETHVGGRFGGFTPGLERDLKRKSQKQGKQACGEAGGEQQNEVMMGMEKDGSENEKSHNTDCVGCRRNPCIYCAACALLPRPVHPAPSRHRRVLVSQQPFRRGANQEGTFLPSPSAPRRKDPVGAGSAPRPLLPGEGRLRGGRWKAVGRAWLGRIRTEGAAARRLTQCRCPGAVVTAPAPAGGCPLGPASVVSAAAQVSPGPPPPGAVPESARSAFAARPSRP